MITSLNRLLATTLTIALGTVSFGNAISRVNVLPERSTRAAVALDRTNYSDVFAPPAGTQEPAKQYSTEQLEELRTKLIELVDTVKDFSDLILPDDVAAAGKLAAAKKQFQGYTTQQLSLFRGILNPVEMNTRLGGARVALEQYRPALEAIRQDQTQSSKLRQSSAALTMDSTALPDREAPDSVCNALVGSGRVTSAMTNAADVIFLAAAGLRAGLSRGCNQVLVVLGEGGNTSAACIAADVVYYVALALRTKLTSCEKDYDGRTLDAIFNRTETIHTDLANSVANDNTNKTAIISNISSSQTAIIGNDNTNTTSIINNDNANKTTITTAISNSQNTIVDNTNAGKNELRDLILRTQIEANLAADGSDTFVGWYVTPAANGGYLELARSIVIVTIAKLAGKKTTEANKQLAAGDAQKAAGNFSKAYFFYRQAYRTAVKQD